MKRLHIHIHTEDLEKSVRYYSALFGAEPARREADYAKWLLDDPAANIAVSSRGGKPGVDHVGVSIDGGDALSEAASRLRAIEAPLFEEEATTCCYANSDKFWSHDPQGTVCELFHTKSDSDVFGKDRTPEAAREPADKAACCPATA